MTIAIKRIYEEPAADDGARVLVDRVWPRGVSKARAALDRWVPEVAPSTALRRWFAHEPARWVEFQRRYREELRARDTELDELRRLARGGRLTLLYSARDERHNQAAALRAIMLDESRAKKETRGLDETARR